MLSPKEVLGGIGKGTERVLNFLLPTDPKSHKPQQLDEVDIGVVQALQLPTQILDPKKTLPRGGTSFEVKQVPVASGEMQTILAPADPPEIRVPERIIPSQS